MTAAPLSLVADIGGTNTRVALAEGTLLRPDSVRRFSNAAYAGLEDVLRQYLAEAGSPEVGGACVAAAGPVRNGVATLTNLDWTIDGAALARSTGAATVAILNDLQAQGHALGHIAAENLRVVIEGPAAAPGASMLVIGVGTGFNAAPVHDTPWGRVVAPSECGHAGMPVVGARDLALAKAVATAHGYAGVEDVLSGRGLERIYAFTASEAGVAGDLAAAAIMAASGEPGPAQEAAKLFVRLLGAEAGNLALIHLPFGGVFLCGGVARAFTDLLGPMGFAEAFRDKGRFSKFMGNFSVSIVEDDYAALTGCATYLSQGARG